MAVADACLILGFGLIVTGVWLLGGPGWASLVAGVVLFLAGGVAVRKEPGR